MNVITILRKHYKNILIVFFILTSFVFISLWHEERTRVPRDTIHGTYVRSIEDGGGSLQMTINTDDNTFIIYNNNDEIDKGSIIQADDYIYTLQSDLQQETYITLNDDNSFYLPFTTSDHESPLLFSKMEFQGNLLVYYDENE